MRDVSIGAPVFWLIDIGRFYPTSFIALLVWLFGIDGRRPITLNPLDAVGTRTNAVVGTCEAILHHAYTPAAVGRRYSLVPKRRHANA